MRLAVATHSTISVDLKPKAGRTLLQSHCLLAFDQLSRLVGLTQSWAGRPQLRRRFQLAAPLPSLFLERVLNVREFLECLAQAGAGEHEQLNELCRCASASGAGSTATRTDVGIARLLRHQRRLAKRRAGVQSRHGGLIQRDEHLHFALRQEEHLPPNVAPPYDKLAHRHALGEQLQAEHLPELAAGLRHARKKRHRGQLFRDRLDMRRVNLLPLRCEVRADGVEEALELRRPQRCERLDPLLGRVARGLE